MSLAEEDDEESSPLLELETGAGLEETGAGFEDVESETGSKELEMEELLPLEQPIRPNDNRDKVINFVIFFIGWYPFLIFYIH